MGVEFFHEGIYILIVRGNIFLVGVYFYMGQYFEGGVAIAFGEVYVKLE